jgi:hypothetical protein
MAASNSPSRGDIESEISKLESEIEETQRAQAEIARHQQQLSQEQQARADQLGVRRTEIQSQQTALEPEKQSKFSALAAEEAKVNSALQRVARDRQRPGGAQTMSEVQRLEAEESAQTARDQLAVTRAEIEDEMVRKSADLQSQLSEMEVAAARTNSEISERNRASQEEVNNLARNRERDEFRLNGLRNRLNTLVTEEAARSERTAAEKLAAQRASEVESQLTAISKDRDRLAGEVKDLAPLVEAQRDATSSQGAQNLSEFYVESADRHRASWQRWLVALAFALALSAIGGLLTVHDVAPTGGDPSTRELFHAIAVAILVVGLLLYSVRITSLQFRVHRNLEAVDRSKAAALRTYNRIVAGASSPDVRTTLVASLADAVFRTSDPGFVDQSSDHVTLIERVAGSAAQRTGVGI